MSLSIAELEKMVAMSKGNVTEPAKVITNSETDAPALKSSYVPPNVDNDNGEV